MSLQSSVHHWILRHWYEEYLWLALLLVSTLGAVWNIWDTLDQLLISPPEAHTVIPPKLTALPLPKDLDIPIFGLFIPDEKLIAVDATLSQKVVGILYTADQTQAQIVLQEDGGFDKIYYVGDMIVPGVKIKSIHPTSAILLYADGSLKRLRLPRTTLKFSEASPPLKMNKEP
jgi:hypothetical protein